MELLVGVIIATLIQGYKKLNEKFGVNNSKLLVLGSVFVLSFGYTLLKFKGVITDEFIKTITTLFLATIGTYQTIFKLILTPVITKFKEK
ncbi:MAG TPA: hypothetical protein PK698_06525 [Bacilli bacterium]|nr:hypothetical protein [Bacilli bacterium]